MSKKFVSVLCVILAALLVISLVAMVLPSAAGAVSQSQIDVLKEQKEALTAKKQAASKQIAKLKTSRRGIWIKRSAGRQMRAYAAGY